MRILLFILLLISLGACADAAPRGFPWYGVEFDLVNSTPQELERIIQELPGMNSIELRLRINKDAAWNGVPFETAWVRGFDAADAALDVCKRYRLHCVLSLEDFTNPVLPFSYTSPLYWSDPNNVMDLLVHVDDLASHFSIRGRELAAYQVLSEPVVISPSGAIDPPNWLQTASDIITTIRLHDPARWIVYAPPVWGLPGSYKNTTPLPFDKIVYSAHMYYPHVYTHQGINGNPYPVNYPGQIGALYWDSVQLKASMQALRDFQLKYDVPIWIGEFNALRWALGHDNYVLDLVDIFKEWDWGFAYFDVTPSGYNGWNPNYNETYTPGNDYPADYVGFSSNAWALLRKIFDGI